MTPNLRLPAGVSIVHAASTPPLLVKGRCLSQEGDAIVLEVPVGTSFPAGAQLVVDFAADAGISRAIVHLLQGVPDPDQRITARITRVPTPEKREYPRMNGGITLRYFVVPPTGQAQIEAWLRGGAEVGKVFEPDPFMNFSVTGLAFDDVETCTDGDLLGFTITVPGAPHTWRGAASVVRVWKIPVDERDDSIPATHRVAVNFTDLPDDAREALRAHTQRIQEAWL
jgi:hypothetical protein